MKKKKIAILILFCFVISVVFLPEVMAAVDYEKICDNQYILEAMRIVGVLIQLVKWVVPIILIVLGMVGYGKAAISGDDNATSKATSSLLKKFIAAIVIFLIPTIITAFLNFIDITDGIMDNERFSPCTKCLFDPINDCGSSGTP